MNATQIRAEEQTPTSDAQLRQMLGSDLVIVKYPELANFDTLGSLLDVHGRAVILFLTEGPSSGHWICVFTRPDGSAHFWDPYGRGVDADFEWLTPERQRALGQTDRHMTRLLDQAVADGHDVFVNRWPYQRLSKLVSTCGDHIAARLFFNHLSAQDYHDLVLSDGDADAFVVQLTNALLNK